MRRGRGLKPAFLMLSALVLTMVVLLGCGRPPTSLAPPNPRVSTGTTSAVAGTKATGDELYPVVSGGKWGFIDKTGAMVIPPQYDEVALRPDNARGFYHGLVAVLEDGRWRYIDRTGTVVFQEVSPRPS